MGAIQIIIRPTFLEWLDTSLDLEILDNIIKSLQEAIFGILRGNLKYHKFIYNIYPKISYNQGDKYFDKVLS